MMIRAAHKGGAADGVTFAVDVNTGLDQSIFYGRVVNSLARVILG
jgi:hypothetical protein